MQWCSDIYIGKTAVDSAHAVEEIIEILNKMNIGNYIDRIR